jgi:hypothetical protein
MTARLIDSNGVSASAVARARGHRATLRPLLLTRDSLMATSSSRVSGVARRSRVGRGEADGVVPMPREVHRSIPGRGHSDARYADDASFQAGSVHPHACHGARGRLCGDEHMHDDRVAEHRHPDQRLRRFEAEHGVGMQQRHGVDAGEIALPGRERVPGHGRRVDALADANQMPAPHRPLGVR